ncbi:MAG TPA: protoporphyrinogen oxidase [Pseudogracilibacillus sp.]|nr:protoporphyrinogen oxidase [Pseudogracilibacillus sp.]
MSKNILIIGGGITGLSTAYYLKKEIQNKNLPYSIKLVEASDRLGGKIETVKKEGFTIERGPDSFLSRKPPTLNLIKSLGMEDQLVRNSTGQAYVLVKGKLHKIPSGSFMGIPIHLKPFLFSGLVSPIGKLRAGFDLVKKKSAPAKDQPLGTFFRYRFGDELVENLIEPLLGGIYSGDLDKMSLMATFPDFYETEQKYGSLIKGLQATKPKPLSKKEKKNRPGAFFALKNGFESLVVELGKQFTEDEVTLNCAVDHVEKKAEHYNVLFDNGTVYQADSIVVATPHNTLPKMFSEYSYFDHFKAMPQTSVANVALAFDKTAIKKDLDGTGYVVSRNSDFRITACTWTHKKWAHAAPDDKILLRTYVGRPDDQDVVNLSDDEIIEVVLNDLNKTMKINKDPLFTVVTRFKNKMPQYTVGHTDRVRETKAEMVSSLPGVYIAGSSLSGVAVPDCIEQGEEAVESVLQYLG